MAPTKVEVLFEGYSQRKDGEDFMLASCTCTLVTSDAAKIIVDTMTAWDGDRIREALADRDISTDEITFAVGTHGHSDHLGNLNLFLKAKHIVGNSMNLKNIYFDILLSGENLRISPDIEIIPTPGHTASCVSLIVSNTELGTVAITGDLFEKEEDSFDPSIWQKFAGSENPLEQIRSRVKILGIADHIVPGHGAMFKVTDEIRVANMEEMRKLDELTGGE